MIQRHQPGVPSVELVLIGGYLVGPPPVPLLPYHYTCTNPLELGMLQAKGITARLTYPPGTVDPIQIMLEAKK